MVADVHLITRKVAREVEQIDQDSRCMRACCCRDTLEAKRVTRDLLVWRAHRRRNDAARRKAKVQNETGAHRKIEQSFERMHNVLVRRAVSVPARQVSIRR